jgi:dephospho-CoA kinase
MRLAIVGKMRSGKDTFAKYFTDLYGFKPLAFGNGITDVITRYFPEAFIMGKPREHYQVIGQTFRELDPDIWV